MIRGQVRSGFGSYWTNPPAQRRVSELVSGSPRNYLLTLVGEGTFEVLTREDSRTVFDVIVVIALPQ